MLCGSSTNTARVSLHSEDGINPVREFCCIVKYTRVSDNIPSELGIPPSKLFRGKNNCLIELNVPSVDGNVPDNLFLFAEKYIIAGHWFVVITGRFPVNELVSTRNVTKFVNNEIVEGNVP